MRRCVGAYDAKNPRPVIGIVGSAQGGVSLPWRDRRRRAGRAATRSPVSPRALSPAGFTLTRPGRNAFGKLFSPNRRPELLHRPNSSMPDQSSKHQSFTLNHLASRFGNCRVPTALMRKR